MTQPVPLKKSVAGSDGSNRPGSDVNVKAVESQATPAIGFSQSPQAVEDGTNQLLKWGGGTLIAGIFFALLTKVFLGGIGPQGPHTNSGWMALIITMMCLPFGFLLFLLGGLKWLRNRRRPADSTVRLSQKEAGRTPTRIRR